MPRNTCDLCELTKKELIDDTRAHGLAHCQDGDHCISQDAACAAAWGAEDHPMTCDTCGERLKYPYPQPLDIDIEPSRVQPDKVALVVMWLEDKHTDLWPHPTLSVTDEDERLQAAEWFVKEVDSFELWLNKFHNDLEAIERGG